MSNNHPTPEELDAAIAKLEEALNEPPTKTEVKLLAIQDQVSAKIRDMDSDTRRKFAECISEEYGMELEDVVDWFNRLMED